MKTIKAIAVIITMALVSCTPATVETETTETETVADSTSTDSTNVVEVDTTVVAE